MKLFRFSLLSAYFAVIKNKKKALLIINIGIFLSIFAATSAAISYFVEKKINQNEFLLIEEQTTKKDVAFWIAEIESEIVFIESLLFNENQQIKNINFISWSEVGNKIISNKDFFLPIIYTSLLDSADLQEFIDMQFDGMSINEIVLNFVSIWEQERIDEIKSTLEEFEIKYLKYKKINFDHYKQLIYQSSPSDLFNEINKNKLYSVSNKESLIYKDYLMVDEFNQATLKYFKMFLQVMRSLEATSNESIEETENKIINLSNNEKNLIFITFILQLIVFIFIQIFEVSSVNLTTKKKLEL